MPRSLLVLLPLACSCPGSILPQYEAARDAALAAPGPLPTNWQPDVVVELSGVQTDELVTLMLEEYGSLTENFGVAGLADATVTLTVRDLVLRSASGTGALSVDASLDGLCSWRVLGRPNQQPFRAKAAFDLAPEVKEQDGAFTVQVRPSDVRSVSLDGLGNGVTATLTGPVQAWIRGDLLKRVPPLTVGTFGSPELPLRAVKMLPGDGGLRVGMLSSSRTPGTVSLDDADAGNGFEVALSTDSLVDAAAKKSFEAGAVAYDVVVEPTSLELSDATFALGIRLWRIEGRGWWRDYLVTGDAEVVSGRLKLHPKDVAAVDRSAGAVLVDPLAALGEGIILKAIEDAVDTSLPLSRKSTIAGKRLEVKVSGIRGDRGRLVVSGRVAEASRPKK